MIQIIIYFNTNHYITLPFTEEMFLWATAGEAQVELITLTMMERSRR